MSITPYQPVCHKQLVNIWLRAVRATHHFLTEDDIIFYHQLVDREALTTVELWMALDDQGNSTGFIGLDGPKVDMLFVDPDYHSRGIGRKLLDHAASLKGTLTVDVNEQNPLAVTFYERYGFIQMGRSELDGSGRPFPLLHMALAERPLER
jgi:putative acetyltransferase